MLTPDEKLIARTLINAERDGKPQPTVSEIAIAVGINEGQVDRGLLLLERYEIVQRAASKGAGYKVTIDTSSPEGVSRIHVVFDILKLSAPILPRRFFSWAVVEGSSTSSGLKRH